MEKKVVVVSSIVIFLGLLSAATSFAAEATRIKRSQVQVNPPYQCVYPQSPAVHLGLTAAMALMVSQIIINVASGCICCRRTPQIPNSKWRVALLSFVLSWFTFVIAFLMLLTGAALNDQRNKDSVYFGFGDYYCFVVRPGVFAGAAILTLSSVAFGIVYYITLTEGKNGSNSGGDSSYPNQGGIVMGQPQIPRQSQEPVFVHEDTYVRRQFT
ncbi:hypothetical protein Lalb_Chr19g0139871 [Lupinus albus]|uniref:Transmembrane protein n=1 Tax=Lupinus albus TaxID=3870 RepID=A0A6A4NVW5_LUPAL|nr:hypothetical protein Lalb_Chr19g0139871 [Lupinus albus]